MDVIPAIAAITRVLGVIPLTAWLRRRSGPVVIRVHGGLPGEPMEASVDGMPIARLPGETVDAFEARVTDAARAGQVVVIGGVEPDLFVRKRLQEDKVLRLGGTPLRNEDGEEIINLRTSAEPGCNGPGGPNRLRRAVR